MALVLIVDDEEDIVTLTSMALRQAGFETIGACCAGRARELWRPEVDLLLTDCMMPGELGDQLAAELKKLKPGLKIVYMSGNAAEAIEQSCPLSCPLSEGANFMRKPFDFESLLAIVRQALAGEAATG